MTRTRLVGEVRCARWEPRYQWRAHVVRCCRQHGERDGTGGGAFRCTGRKRGLSTRKPSMSKRYDKRNASWASSCRKMERFERIELSPGPLAERWGGVGAFICSAMSVTGLAMGSEGVVGFPLAALHLRILLHAVVIEWQWGCADIDVEGFDNRAARCERGRRSLHRPVHPDLRAALCATHSDQ